MAMNRIPERKPNRGWSFSSFQFSFPAYRLDFPPKLINLPFQKGRPEARAVGEGVATLGPRHTSQVALPVLAGASGEAKSLQAIGPHVLFLCCSGF